MRKTMRLLGLLAVWLAVPPVFAELPSDMYTTQTKTATSSFVATDTVLWTPASGKRIILQGLIVCAQVAVSTIEFESSDVDIIPPFNVESGGCKVFSSGGAAIWMGATDGTIAYSRTSGGTIGITAWGYEIQ